MSGQTPILRLPFPTGTDPLREGDNAIESLARAVENARPVGVAVGNPTNPAVPLPATARVLVQGGSIVTTTDQVGNTRITFGAPFPTGLIGCVVMAGNNNVQWFPQVADNPWGIGDRTNVVVQCALAAGGVVANGAVRLNYVALGW